MAVGAIGLHQGILTNIVKHSAAALNPVADGHDGNPKNPGFDLICSQNPEVLGCRDAGQHKKIDAVVVPVGDYLSI